MRSEKIKRFIFIIQIFIKYGLNELIPSKKYKILFKFASFFLFWLSKNKYHNKTVAERLRLALQDLGPVWIKFGQMLSTRKDIVSSSIYKELSLLQDNVNNFDGKLARNCIELSLGSSVETWFDEFNETPLASASIAQIHSAKLKQNNKEIVIKIIRPNIIQIIKSDIKLMYFLATCISFLYKIKKLQIIKIIYEYEKTIMNELNLLHEMANTIQLRKNFKNSQLLYIPKVYTKYCRKNIMVMERIYGIHISNIDELKQNGINMKLLAERGVIIFFTQVFRDSFFHADMHPGNIFISKNNPKNPQYIGIDCAIVGSLNKKDQEYLAENFIAFFNRDYRKIAELHIDYELVPWDTNIENFTFTIQSIFDPMFKQPISKISFAKLLYKLFKLSKVFNIEIQPQLLLLQKTLFYIEGLGKQLYPQLDLWKTAKPFLENWMHEQSGVIKLVNTLKNKTPFLIKKIPEIPDLIYKTIKQHNTIQKHMLKITHKLCKQQKKYYQSYCLMFIGFIYIIYFILCQIFYIQSPNYIISMILLGIIIWIIGWKTINKK